MACSCGGACGGHEESPFLPADPGFVDEPAYLPPPPWSGEANGPAGCAGVQSLPFDAEVLAEPEIDGGMGAPAGDELESFRAELLAEVQQILDQALAVRARCGGGGGGVPSSRTIATTAPLSGGGDLSADRTLTTSMNTNKLIGRSTAGVGVMEEVSVGTGLSLSGGTLSAAGGSEAAANAMLRALCF